MLDLQALNCILTAFYLNIPCWLQVAFSYELIRKDIRAAHNLVDRSFRLLFNLIFFIVGHVSKTGVVIIYGKDAELVRLWILLGYLGFHGAALSRTYFEAWKI